MREKGGTFRVQGAIANRSMAIELYSAGLGSRGAPQTCSATCLTLQCTECEIKYNP